MKQIECRPILDLYDFFYHTSFCLLTHPNPTALSIVSPSSIYGSSHGNNGFHFAFLFHWFICCLAKLPIHGNPTGQTSPRGRMVGSLAESQPPGSCWHQSICNTGYNISYELVDLTSHLDGGQLLSQLLLDLKYLLWLYEESPLDVSIWNSFIFSSNFYLL